MPDEKCEQNRSLQQNGSLVCLVSTEFLSLYHKERLPTVGIKRQALPKKRRYRLFWLCLISFGNILIHTPSGEIEEVFPILFFALD